MESQVYNMCCIEGMKHYPDKFFDLAVVDPPYGLGDKLKPRGGMIGKYGSFKGMGKHSWDNAKPPFEYFLELFRVSKEQIIWGGNYFLEHLPSTQCFLIWDKMNGTNPMADCEMAWTSFKNKVARMYKGHIFSGIGNTNYNPIHPTQKPEKLYDWTFQNFSKKGWRILDTHLGSQSSRIAAYKHGLEFVGFEIDKEYYEAGCKRYEEFIKQPSLFQMAAIADKGSAGKNTNTLFDAA